MTSRYFLILSLLTAVTAAVCGFAVWKGGEGERRAGLLIFTVMVLQRVAEPLAPDEFGPTLKLIGDGVPALVLLVLAVQFASPWLGAIMFFYAAQFALHSFYIVLVKKPDIFHFIINDINLMGIHLALVLGTAMAWRRRSQTLSAHAAV